MTKNMTRTIKIWLVGEIAAQLSSRRWWWRWPIWFVFTSDDDDQGWLKCWNSGTLFRTDQGPCEPSKGLVSKIGGNREPEGARGSRTSSQREPERAGQRAREIQREPEGARESQREPERARERHRDYEPTLHFIVPWTLCLRVVHKRDAQQ